MVVVSHPVVCDSVRPQWTGAHQAPLSVGFSRQEYWSGLHSLLQRIFPTQGLNLGLLHCRRILYHLSYRDYPAEVTNRFKGLDLVDRVPEELCVEDYNIVQEAMTKIIPKKEKCKKVRWLSEEALEIAEERREVKGKEK